jgi:hypothetical protein
MAVMRVEVTNRLDRQCSREDNHSRRIARPLLNSLCQRRRRCYSVYWNQRPSAIDRSCRPCALTRRPLQSAVVEFVSKPTTHNAHAHTKIHTLFTYLCSVGVEGRSPHVTEAAIVHT